MASRYNNARPFINNNELYEEFFEDGDVNYIRQYRTGMLTQPTGDPTLWWIIAWYNLKPTESHFKIGDLVYIPLPLDRVLSVLKRE